MSSPQVTLTLTQEEREPLLRILEQVLREKRVEVHRTEAPEYREYVLREEALLDRLVEQLRGP
jgi:hypothetical protein